MFKNVRSLLLMKGKREDKDLREKVGYYGEGIILDLTDLGFGSCWVGGTFDREKFTCDADEYAMDLIDLGIAKKHFEEGAGGTFALGNGGSFTKE